MLDNIKFLLRASAFLLGMIPYCAVIPGIFVYLNDNCWLWVYALTGYLIEDHTGAAMPAMFVAALFLGLLPLWIWVKFVLELEG